MEKSLERVSGPDQIEGLGLKKTSQLLLSPDEDVARVAVVVKFNSLTERLLCASETLQTSQDTTMSRQGPRPQRIHGLGGKTGRSVNNFSSEQ